MERTVTAIVCAHNEQEYIQGCLDSLVQQNLKPSQIIVVLDQCTDATSTIISRYSIQVIEKNVRNWKNSYAENLELARQKAKAEYYAIVDADVILDKDYFEKTTAKFNDKTAGISGRMITAAPGALGSLMRFWEKTYHFSPFKTYLPAGCGLVVRKQFLDEIGGFQDVPAPDTYLHQKALGLGLRFAFIDETKVYHRRKLTLRGIIKTQIDYGRRRRKMSVSFWKTFLHALFRLRPFVLYGWLRGNRH